MDSIGVHFPIKKPSTADIKSFAAIIGCAPLMKPLVSIKEPSSFRGDPAIFFSAKGFPHLAEPFKFSLVGKFSHGRPSMDIIRKVFASMDLKAEASIGLIDNKHILIRLNLEEDFHRLCLKEIWFIPLFPMHIFKWSHDFHPTAESSVAPVWISFHLLPVHFHNKPNVFSIASPVVDNGVKSPAPVT